MPTFTGVTLEPNPVDAGETYKISVSMLEDVYGILTKNGELLMTKDDRAIERIPAVAAIMTQDDKMLMTKDGLAIERKKEV